MDAVQRFPWPLSQDLVYVLHSQELDQRLVREHNLTVLVDHHSRIRQGVPDLADKSGSIDDLKLDRDFS